MKIIGKAAEYGDEWICTVTTTELEKFLGLYYGKMPPIKLGDVIDLGRGHDYAAQIGSAMTKTREFVQANQAIVTAIMQGMSIEAVTAAAGKYRDIGAQFGVSAQTVCNVKRRSKYADVPDV